MIKKILFISLFLCFKPVYLTYAQGIIIPIEYHGSDSASNHILLSIPYTFNAKSASLQEIELDFKNHFYRHGYLDILIDSVVNQYDTLMLFFTAGSKYEWQNLKISPLARVALTSYRKGNGDFNAVSPWQISSIHESILNYYENHGYPFVLTYFDSVNIINNRVSALLQVDLGTPYYIDTIIIEGNLKLSHHFLQEYLSIRTNELWSEYRFGNIEGLMDNLEFVRLGAAPMVSFYNGNAAIKLNLKPKKSNNFDAILGFFTNQQTNALDLTGNVNLKLVNSFGMAEEFLFAWQRPVKGNQQLEIKYSQPYILKSKLGFGYGFSLFRWDSLFVNVENSALMSFRFEYETYFYLKSEIANSIITAINPDSNLASANSTLIGVGFFSDKRNYRLNPSSGFLFDFSVLAGSRIQSLSVVELDNQRFAKSVIQLVYEYYFNFAPKNVLHFKNISSLILSQNMAINEFSRIGGLKSLRGFDEQSLPAKQYSISTLEYRFLLSRNSYLAAFYNIGILNSSELNSYDLMFYNGFGVGALLDSEVGILSLYLAMGKNPELPIVFRNAKVHFGYLIKF